MNSALSVFIVDDNVKMRSMIAEIIKSKTKIIECTGGFVTVGLLKCTPCSFYHRL